MHLKGLSSKKFHTEADLHRTWHTFAQSIIIIIILNPNGGTIRGTVLPYLPARISPPDTTNNHSKTLSTQICYKPLNITLSSQDYLHIFGFSAI